VQHAEQRLGLLQIKHVEAFGEPAAERSEQFTSLLPLPLIPPEPRHRFGIDAGSTIIEAIAVSDSIPQPGKIENTINAYQYMIIGNELPQRPASPGRTKRRPRRPSVGARRIAHCIRMT
jgi:hypothetical protein